MVQPRLDDSVKEAGKAQIVAAAFAAHELQFAATFTVIEQNTARFRSLP
jgi:hypothetical protein